MRLEFLFMTRSEAKAQGLKRYFTGKPCKRGHVSERRVSTGICLHCSGEFNAGRREYMKQWHLLHKAETQAKAKKRYAEQRDAINSKKRAFWRTPEGKASLRRRYPKQRVASRAYYQRHIDLCRKRSREQAAKRRQLNRDGVNRYKRTLYQANPGLVLAQCAIYRAAHYEHVLARARARGKARRADPIVGPKIRMSRIPYARGWRERLADGYVRGIIADALKAYGLQNSRNIPKELIAAKRAHVRVLRSIKQRKTA